MIQTNARHRFPSVPRHQFTGEASEVTAAWGNPSRCHSSDPCPPTSQRGTFNLDRRVAQLWPCRVNPSARSETASPNSSIECRDNTNVLSSHATEHLQQC